MPAAAADRTMDSLARIETGEASEIRKIMFGSLRELCDRLGIHEGDVVRCQASSPSNLILRRGDGRVIRLERDRARFIRASPVA